MNKKITSLFFTLFAATFVMAQTAPVLHFKIKGNIADSSTNSFATTAIGSVTYTNGRHGDASSGLETTAGAIQLSNAMGAYKVSFPFTFATWMKINGFKTVNPLFTSEDDQTSYSGIWVQVLADGTVAANVGNGGLPNSTGRKSAVTNSPVITNTNAWYQIVVVANSISNFAIYVNGVLAPSTLSGSATSMVYLNGMNSFGKVGSYNKGSSSNYYFDGVIDEMALWSTGINESELDAILLEGTTNYNTAVENKEEVNFSFYPNPSNDNISITLPSSFNGESTSIKIYDALGALVKQEQITVSGVHDLLIQDLAKGAYVLQIQNDRGSANKALIAY
ncbi:MAG: T9SS type A sorting domain-containing protein [Bacteroidetes bacterium]|nr:T9SS type A sorting domain-containing protein [Bacteroidota bacterium]